MTLVATLGELREEKSRARGGVAEPFLRRDWGSEYTWALNLVGLSPRTRAASGLTVTITVVGACGRLTRPVS